MSFDDDAHAMDEPATDALEVAEAAGEEEAEGGLGDASSYYNRGTPKKYYSGDYTPYRNPKPSKY